MSESQPTQAETTAERHARQLSQIRRLAELGMQLAEACAARAAMVIARLPPGPEQAGEPLPPRVTHPVTLFNQLSSTVRQAVKLEERIILGAARSQADPRRAAIRIAIREATKGTFSRRSMNKEADDLLKTELALDPDGATPLPELLATICADVGFQLDYEKLQTSLAAREAERFHQNNPASSQPIWPPPRPRPPH